MEARFCWWSDGLPTVWSCIGDSCAFRHPVRGAGGSGGAVWGNPGGSIVGNIAVQRENRREGGEEHRVVEGDVEEEKKRNGPTFVVSCTSVVRAHRGANKKAEHRRTSSPVFIVV